MLMATPQESWPYADGVAAGGLAEMLMASHRGVSRNADGITAGG